MFQRDYILRQIEELSTVTSLVFFKKKRVLYELPQTDEYSDSDLLYFQLKQLVKENKLNEAEDLLFDRAQPGDKNSLAVALDFYQTLNEMDDEALEAASYSREEIRQGLEDFLAEFGFQL